MRKNIYTEWIAFAFYLKSDKLEFNNYLWITEMGDLFFFRHNKRMTFFFNHENDDF